MNISESVKLTIADLDHDGDEAGAQTQAHKKRNREEDSPALRNKFGAPDPDRVEKIAALLSYRENQMFHLFLEGAHNEDLSSRMVMTPSHVKDMKAQIFKKLKVTSLSGLFELVHGDSEIVVPQATPVPASVAPSLLSANASAVFPVLPEIPFVVSAAKVDAVVAVQLTASAPLQESPEAKVEENSVWEQFTEQQAQIVRGLVSGLEPKQIAKKMGIPAYDVTQILIGVYDQFGIANRAQFLAFMADKKEPVTTVEGTELALAL